MTLFWLVLLALLTAVVCALPGVFLVLRSMSMMSDAISHAVLPGIVAAYLMVGNRHSPLLMLGAAVSGTVMVLLIEAVRKTKLIQADAAIGVVFPALFSIGVILIARNMGRIPLNQNAVVTDDIALATLYHLRIGGVDFGPQSLWILLGLLLLNGAFIGFFYKELQLTTFDEGHAASLGFNPAIVHYAFIALVAITTVGTFETAGSILVIALMIAPASTAYLLAHRLRTMLWLSVAIAAFSALSGLGLSILADSSPAGGIAMMNGICFVAAYLLRAKVRPISK